MANLKNVDVWRWTPYSLLLLLMVFLSPLKLALAQPVIDLSDVGIVALENSGAADAQQPFLHGLAQLHNFEYDFAAQDFRNAQSIDPDFSLAYWGEAMTYNHPIWQQQDREAAIAVLNKYAPTPAARQAKASTELERDLMAAADILFGEGIKQDRDDLFRDFMAGLYEKYPDHVEIAAYYALSIMGTAHEGREFGLYMQAAALMQQFIVLYPNHPGVAHYLIHATDDPIHAPLGLKAAKAYADIAPHAAHAQHMTTHIFLALGDWDGVIRANERAVGLANEKRATENKGPIGCGHYPSWLMYGYLQQGKRDEAYQIMSLCRQNIKSGELKGFEGAYAWQRLLYLFDTKEWDGDIALDKVDVGDNNRALLEMNVADGYVALHNGDFASARAAYRSAQEHMKSIHAFFDDQGAPKDHKPRVTATVQLMQLEAQIMFDEGHADDAIALVKEVVALEAGLSFGFGPPDPPKPSYELLGEMLIKSGKMEEARSVLKTALSRTPEKLLSRQALSAIEEELASQ